MKTPATFLPENHSPDTQTSHKISYHNHQQQKASPATVLPENSIPHNQSSKINSHQQHQSSQSGQVAPPGFHQEDEDQSLIQERSVVEDQLYSPKDTLASSNPPVNSRDKATEPKAHDQKTNIVHGGNVNVIVIHSHSHRHGQNADAQAQASEARLSKPPGDTSLNIHRTTSGGLFSASFEVVAAVSIGAVAAAGVTGSISLANGSAPVVEAKSGVSFPPILGNSLRLLGVGLRKKSILGLKNIDVYAFGVYANGDDVKKFLGNKYNNVFASELKDNEDLNNDLMEADISMIVRLHIVYDKLSI
ncbi:hypothetical protein V6N11_012746 [Hibiscus sabdariffa]|uniref:Chalcone-flavonone isomerase family protein n=1 Tax=Hibiscus sabdariffa TaxID=183260 RepID=A0ABR2A4P6_9ROSI